MSDNSKLIEDLIDQVKQQAEYIKIVNERLRNIELNVAKAEYELQHLKDISFAYQFNIFVKLLPVRFWIMVNLVKYKFKSIFNRSK